METLRHYAHHVSITIIVNLQYLGFSDNSASNREYIETLN